MRKISFILFFTMASLSLTAQNVKVKLAGSEDDDYTGNNNLASVAKFQNLTDITVDEWGNIYIVDSYTHYIRKIDTTGIITAIAGIGTANYNGDGGPAEIAGFNSPTGLYYSNGILYVADAGNHRIRKIDENGIINTVAGNGVSGFSGDGGSALQASLNYPVDIALDQVGNLFIVDRDNSRIRKVDQDGVITTSAGNGEFQYAGDGGQATEASLNTPEQIIFNQDNELIIADTYNNLIRKVNAQGIIQTIAGRTDYVSDIGDGGPATEAKFNYPRGMVIDQQGNLFIADYHQHRIRKIDLDSIVTTIAGTVTSGYSGDGDSAIYAEINYPRAISFDPNQNLLLVDESDYIRKVGQDQIITTIAGIGYDTYTGDEGFATQAPLSGIESLSIDDSSNLYFSAYYDHVRKISPNGFIYTYSDVDNVTGMTFDRDGNLLVARPSYHRIRKIEPNGNNNIIAGNGAAEYNGDGLQAIQTAFNYPEDIAVDKSGNIFIADRNNNRIRKIGLDGIVSTIAGTGEDLLYTVDSIPATDANIHLPRKLFIDNDDRVYFSTNTRVHMIDQDGIIYTIAGGGGKKYETGIPAREYNLNTPAGVTVDSEGNVFICEYGDNRLHYIDKNGYIWLVDYFYQPKDVVLDYEGHIIVAEYNRITKVIPGPDMSVSRNDTLINYADSIDFGIRSLKNDSSVYLSINNSGLGNLNISESWYEITGDNVDNFTASLNGSVETLGIGDTVSLTVTFTPKTSGPVEAQLILYTNDPDRPEFLINLFGEVALPEIEIEDANNISIGIDHQLDFGELSIGQEETIELTITNVAPGFLVAELDLTGTAFVLENDSVHTFELGLDEFLIIGVKFLPDRVGDLNEELVISTNDLNEAVFKIALSGSSIPVFELDSFPGQVSEGDQDPVILFTADWGKTPVDLSFAYKTSSKTAFSDFTSITYSPDTSNYRITIPIQNISPPGIDFVIRAEDGIFETREKNGAIFIEIFSQGDEVLTSVSGGTLLDYTIIALPFKDFVGRAEVFNEIEPYDKKKWRLFGYNAATKNFIESPSNLEAGKGYWFLQNDPNTIRVPEKVIFAGDLQLSLKTGWNMIGNPYLGSLNWNEVLDANSPEVTGALRNLIVYERGYRETTSLKAFQGAVIFTERDVDLLIPYAALTSSGARISSEIPNLIANNHTISKEWLCQVNFMDEAGQYSFLNGFGIHENAEVEMDIYDIPMLPFPGEFVSFNIEGFSRNIKRSGSFIKWDAMLSNPGGKDYRLEFDVSLKDDPNTIIVYNKNSGELTNLKSRKFLESAAGISHYLTIYYGREEEILREIGNSVFSIGNPYPNPARSEVFIPVYIGNMDKSPFELIISLIDLQGRLLRSEMVKEIDRQKLLTARVDDLKPGLYQLMIEYGEHWRVFKVHVMR